MVILLVTRHFWTLMICADWEICLQVACGLQECYLVGMVFDLLYVTSSLSMTYQQVVSTTGNHLAFSANQGAPSSNFTNWSNTPPDVGKTVTFTCQRAHPSPLLVSPAGFLTVLCGVLKSRGSTARYSISDINLASLTFASLHSDKLTALWYDGAGSQFVVLKENVGKISEISCRWKYHSGFFCNMLATMYIAYILSPSVCHGFLQIWDLHLLKEDARSQPA